MVDLFVAVKLRQSTVDLLEEAEKVFLKHHPHLDGINITRNLLIKRALKYYIEN